jgi:hypothetical protein
MGDTPANAATSRMVAPCVDLRRVRSVAKMDQLPSEENLRHGDKNGDSANSKA